MEELLTSHLGVPALLASIIIVLCLQLILRVGSFVWEILQKKNEVSEKSIAKLTDALQTNTVAVEKLQNELAQIKNEIATLPQLRLDIKRAFVALKLMAGEEWEEIRLAIRDEIF